MVDDDFEEGEIEGLINDALQAKVASTQQPKKDLEKLLRLF